MTISVGERMPAGSFGVMTDAGPGSLSTDELFSGRKVLFITVPGAFTPTCSAKHLPGILDSAGELAARGIDAIACMAVNDLFVMHAWGKDLGAIGNVTMLADGNADYTRALGLENDSTRWGMGIRSRRAAIIVDDGRVTHVAVDEPGQCDISAGRAILAAI